MRTAPDEASTSNQDDGFDTIAAPEDQSDADVDGDMILGELEYDVDAVAVKTKDERSSVRDDVDDVVNGASISATAPGRNLLHRSAARHPASFTPPGPYSVHQRTKV